MTHIIKNMAQDSKHIAHDIKYIRNDLRNNGGYLKYNIY